MGLGYTVGNFPLKFWAILSSPCRCPAAVKIYDALEATGPRLSRVRAEFEQGLSSRPLGRRLCVSRRGTEVYRTESLLRLKLDL